MGLVHKDGMLDTVVDKEPSQYDPGVECIVIIPDHGISPIDQFQSENSKGHTRCASANRFDHSAGEGILMKRCLQCRVEPIEVSFGIGALFRQAGTFRSETNLIFGRQGDGFNPDPLSPQDERTPLRPRSVPLSGRLEK